MRIGEVAARAGVNVETLRYYERRGLLPEPPRSPSGHRSYGEDAVRFVRAIKDAQSLGFTLAEIEEYLRAARGSGAAVSDALRVRMAAKIDDVDAKIATLRRVRADLARIVGCACESLDHCTCGAAYLARRGRHAPPAPGSTLHVTNGDSTGDTLRRTTLGGAVLSWQDVLHEGPVPAVPPDRLRDVRARFLSECGWGDRRSIRDGLERRDRLFAEALGERRHVVLWFEHDLYDQLQLIQILALADDLDFDPKRFELLEVGSFDGRPDFHGLGELDAEELESLWPKRRPVDDALVTLGRRAWDAVRAPEPTEIETLAAPPHEPLPFLAPALQRLLEELPDTTAGLSRTERQALELLDAGPASPTRLFVAWQQREEAPFLGDAWFFRTLAALGAGARPLVAVEDGAPLRLAPPQGDPRTFAAAPVELTDAGRAVLAGEADRVELLGIDRWLGGTHVEPGNVWRLDSVTGSVVRP